MTSLLMTSATRDQTFFEN